MLFGPAHEVMDLEGVLGTLEPSEEFWEDGCTTKSKSLLTSQRLFVTFAFEIYHKKQNNINQTLECCTWTSSWLAC